MNPETTDNATTFPRVNADRLEFWRGEHRVLHDLSFSFDTPIVRLTGANGSGKTTLLRLLAGFSKPESGVLHWFRNGQVLEALEARNAIAWCSHLDGLNPVLSVAENLLWGVSLTRQIYANEITETLMRYGLGDLHGRAIHTLSAGQKRRIALLRSVMSERSIWLWDEPHANLDTQGRAWVNQLIRDKAAAGGTVIFSAHNAELISAELESDLELVL